MALAYYIPGTKGVIVMVGDSGTFPDANQIGKCPAARPDELTMEGGKVRLATADEIALRRMGSDLVAVATPATHESSAVLRLRTAEEIQADLDRRAAAAQAEQEAATAAAAAALDAECDLCQSSRLTRAIVSVLTAKINILAERAGLTPIKPEEIALDIKDAAKEIQ